MDKNGVLALTDGIVAIAATIMVLEMKVPEQSLSLATLLIELPVFIAYAISISMVYLAWRSHHNTFQKADKLTTDIYLINGI